MIARAPGKVVISGAYAVLDGAPAIVAAVDRYVSADARRSADFVTDEVRAALGSAPPPWFDATELRQNERKLGLGSSAAILVASLAALELEKRGPLDDRALASAVFAPALVAHAKAQRGGSGIDVAASAHGGILLARRSGDGLDLETVALPVGLSYEVFACGEPASTQGMVERVRGLAEHDARLYSSRMSCQMEAAEQAADALRCQSGAALVLSLRAQRAALAELGVASGVPIVTAGVAKLADLAELEDAAFLPAGAGGGDIALYVGLRAPSAALSKLATELGLEPLKLRLGARGVHPENA